MALGETLRKARKDRELTASEVAAATRMKVQMVEALEKEDFSKIAAPIYAKGFIKLYAEHVGLDPTPLLNEYTARFVGQVKTPSLNASDERPAMPPEAQPKPAPRPGPKVESDRDDLFTAPQKAPPPQATPELAAAPEEPPSIVPPEPESPDLFAAPPVPPELPEEEPATEQRDTVFGRISSTIGRVRPRGSAVKLWSIVAGCILVLVFVISGLSRCIHRPEREVDPLIETPTHGLEIVDEPPEPYFD